jgi:uncharacterized membrane protein
MHIGLLMCCTAFILFSHYYGTLDQHGAFSLQIKMLMTCTLLCQLKIKTRYSASKQKGENTKYTMVESVFTERFWLEHSHVSAVLVKK